MSNAVIATCAWAVGCFFVRWLPCINWQEQQQSHAQSRRDKSAEKNLKLSLAAAAPPMTPSSPNTQGVGDSPKRDARSRDMTPGAAKLLKCGLCDGEYSSLPGVTHYARAAELRCVQTVCAGSWPITRGGVWSLILLTCSVHLLVVHTPHTTSLQTVRCLGCTGVGLFDSAV